MNNLKREYYFSDTYGTSSVNPLEKPDADAIITTDFRSRPRGYRHEKFDIYDNPHVTDHILRMVHDLDAQLMDTFTGRKKDEYAASTTGILINSAPRTSSTGNGSHFYVASSREGRIRIVTTPLQALSPVKNEIEVLEHLPNNDNGLYPNGEQFRSSYVGVLLQDDHGIPLENAKIDEIDEPRTDLHLAFVDRFGNLITHAGETERNEALKRIRSSRNSIYLTLNGKEYGPFTTSENLGSATPGDISVYPNGDIDIARKWQGDETPAKRLEESAYNQLGRPAIGTGIKVDVLENVELAVE